jgi:hypothetical protein
MRYVSFKKYAGLIERGTAPLGLPDEQHIIRASWLTAMVESGGVFGTVMNYDGTAMTAGIHQAIAVYPRALRDPDNIAINDQGPLWKLLNRCFQAYSSYPITQDFIDQLADFDLRVINGVARRISTGKPADGKYIRKCFTGTENNRVPKQGPLRSQAHLWVSTFHHYFSSEFTYELQLNWGIEKLIKRLERLKLRYTAQLHYRNRTPADVLYRCRDASIADSPLDISPWMDLAMCVWLSFTVNAPAIALRHLCAAIPLYTKGSSEEFARGLIRRLGTSSWGRWSADMPNGRYQRTRTAAKKVWPNGLFNGLDSFMPVKL